MMNIYEESTINFWIWVTYTMDGGRDKTEQGPSNSRPHKCDLEFVYLEGIHDSYLTSYFSVFFL